jgi:multiple sugar transport system permease protein
LWSLPVIVVIVGVMIVPIAVVLILSITPSIGAKAGSGLTFANFSYVFSSTPLLTWLGNSLVVSVATVAVAIVIAAPAGYVLSRGRNRLVSAYSLLLFVVQSLPVVTSVIPLFILFAQIHLVDNLVGVTIIHVGSTLSVAIWMMAAYFNSIPIALEEAAWMDGCSVLTGFLRVVLRNSLPGVVSTAIFSFLLAWNDYLVAVVFLRSVDKYTLPIGMQTFFQENATDWGSVMALAVVMMIPPVAVFTFLNRYFSIGGIGGALAGN